MCVCWWLPLLGAFLDRLLWTDWEAGRLPHGEVRPGTSSTLFVDVVLFTLGFLIGALSSTSPQEARWPCLPAWLVSPPTLPSQYFLLRRKITFLFLPSLPLELAFSTALTRSYSKRIYKAIKITRVFTVTWDRWLDPHPQSICSPLGTFTSEQWKLGSTNSTSGLHFEMENGILCVFHLHNHEKCKLFFCSLTFREDSVSCQDSLHLATQGDINVLGKWKKSRNDLLAQVSLQNNS